MVVGGTFDHLHVGHKLLLTAVALVLEPLDREREGRLTIGVTGDALLVNKKYAEVLESWEERWQSTADFLTAIMDFSPEKKSPLAVFEVDVLQSGEAATATDLEGFESKISSTDIRRRRVHLAKV